MQDTTTIRIKKVTKKKFDELKGMLTYDEFLNHLIEFFLTKK